MDGVDERFVLDVNDKIVIPDIQVAVKADVSSLQSRLSKRSELTRFENGQRSCEELRFMNLGLAALRKKHTNILELDNTGDFFKNVHKIVNYITEVGM